MKAAALKNLSYGFITYGKKLSSSFMDRLALELNYKTLFLKNQ
jgi:hypothetical protein